jgi:hypothetical protein
MYADTTTPAGVGMVSNAWLFSQQKQQWFVGLIVLEMTFQQNWSLDTSLPW